MNVVWLATFKQRWIARFKDIGSSHLGRNHNAQSFARAMINHGEQLVGSSIAQLVMDEINCPNVVCMLRPQPDQRGIAVIEALALLAAGRKLQTFLAAEPLDLLVVRTPAFGLQQLADLAISVSPILPGEPDQAFGAVGLEVAPDFVELVAGTSHHLAGVGVVVEFAGQLEKRQLASRYFVGGRGHVDCLPGWEMT